MCDIREYISLHTDTFARRCEAATCVADAATFGLRGDSGERNSCSIAVLRCGVNASWRVSTTAIFVTKAADLLFESAVRKSWRERGADAAARARAGLDLW